MELILREMLIFFSNPWPFSLWSLADVAVCFLQCLSSWSVKAEGFLNVPVTLSQCSVVPGARSQDGICSIAAEL